MSRGRQGHRVGRRQRGSGMERGTGAVWVWKCYQHCLPGSCTITCLTKNVVQLVHWKGLAQSKLVRHRREAGRGSWLLLSSASLIF